MRTRAQLAGLLIALLFVATNLFAGGSAEDADDGVGSQIDYLGVAGVMIRDGNFDRARAALDEVDPTDEGVDTERYFTLRGLVELREGNYREATDSLELAQSAGADDPILNVYLAQAYYATEQYEEAIAAIDEVPNLNQFADLYAILAESYWRLGEQVEAYRLLSRAIELFPDRTQFLRQRIFYLIELNLTQEAAEQGLVYVNSLEDDPEAFVTVGEALRRGGNAALAIETLELGRLRFPASERIYLSLAQAYLDAEQPRNAGEMIQRAAANNFRLYFEAAEIFRRTGEYERSLFLNSQVVDEQRKALQRFNILMSMERYEEAITLERRLEDTGAFEDENIEYAMAFALFQTRQLDEAAEYINRIDGAELFRQATQLRRAIETVRRQQETLTEAVPESSESENGSQ